MPLFQPGVGGGQLVVARIKKVCQHAVEVEIDKERALAQQEPMADQHLLARYQSPSQAREQSLLLRPPLVQAAAAELPFLVPEETELVGFGNQFTPVNVVELETETFHLVFNVSPEQRLDAFQITREKAELELVVEVLRDHLRIVVGLEHDGFAVPDDGHGVVAPASQTPDQRAVAVGDVEDAEADAGVLQNPPLHDAERTPGKLNELDHA